jgi:lipid II:glycine glycyltransferase (peptidoglycan interpeptide bridge formation enzyme)
MEIVDPLNQQGWDELVSSHPSGSFFHTSSWARVLVDSYGYKPTYFSVRENGTLRALLPIMEIDSFLTGRRGVALPFSDYADPFALDEEQYQVLAKRAVEYGKKAAWKTVEIRGGGCPWAEKVISSRFLGHRLNLSRTETEIHAGFRTNMQRNISRALKEGVQIEMSNSPGAVEAYYRLHCITRKSHGIPPQPIIFFRKIQEYVFRQNMGFILLATFRNAVVAGIVLFHHGTKAIYKYGASNEAGKQSRANNLVMWEAIKWSKQKGFKEFCFGRTEIGNEGLRDYKLGYGTSEYLLPYYKYDLFNNSIVEKSGEDISGFFGMCYQKVPIRISRLVGTILYRHIG